MKTETIKRAFWVILILFIAGVGCKKTSIDMLLHQGKADVATERCKKLKGEEKIDALRKVALYYFQQDNFKKAAPLYEEAGDHEKVISCFILADAISDAETYCQKLSGESKQKSARQLARSFYRSGNYQKAIDYFSIAGEKNKVDDVTAKIPAFQLVEKLENHAKNASNPDIKSKITDVSETLKEYIYLDDLLEWQRGTKEELDLMASQLSIKAIKALEDEVAPALIQRITTKLAAPPLTENSLEGLAFHNAKLNSLIKLIRGLDNIASYRKFFTHYSVVYQETPTKDRPKPGNAYNYDEAYKKALSHAQALLETLSEPESEVPKTDFPDYKNDLSVDGDVVVYIAGMMKNIRTRINELDSRCRRLSKLSSAKSVKIQADQYLWDFIAIANRVLHIISTEDYSRANKELLNGYNNAKKSLVSFESTLKAQLAQ